MKGGKMKNKYIILGIVAAILLVVSYIGYSSFTSAEVSAQGESKITVSPDEASVI